MKAVDPVPELIALTLERPDWICANAAVRHLQNFWDDPRVEPALVKISESEARMAEYGLTPAGLAWHALAEERAKRRYQVMMKGAETTVAKVARVRALVAEHPEWLPCKVPRPARPVDLSLEEEKLMLMVLKTAKEAGGAEVLDLLVESGRYARDVALQHPEALLKYARKLGREKALSTPDLIGLLGASKSAAATVVLEDWLKETTGEEQINSLISALVDLPQGKMTLLKLVSDPRPLVVRRAVGWLRSTFPDHESLKAVQGAAERRQAAGADDSEVSYYQAVIRAIQKEIMETEGRIKP